MSLRSHGWITGCCLGWLLAGCGGSWTAADTTTTRDSANQSYQLEVLCGRAPDDAGTCTAATVRAIERANYCTIGSMAYRHAVPIVDAGITCTTPGTTP
jgi:hypothetical protein